MAGRSHLHHHPLSRNSHSQSNTLTRANEVAVLEDRIAAQHCEIQSLLSGNQRLAATHVALKQELATTQLEIRHLSAAAAQVKTERDAEVREVYERSLKMDAEVRTIDAMRLELAQVRADIEKLGAVKQELTSQLQAVQDDLVKARSESEQLPSIKVEIDSMQYEIRRGRTAVEVEKNTRISNLKHSRSMDQCMLSMAREIEELQAELANAKQKRRAETVAANPTLGYGVIHGNADSSYGGGLHSHPCSLHQGTAAQYASGAMPLP